MEFFQKELYTLIIYLCIYIIYYIVPYSILLLIIKVFYFCENVYIYIWI